MDLIGSFLSGVIMILSKVSSPKTGYLKKFFKFLLYFSPKCIKC